MMTIVKTMTTTMLPVAYPGDTELQMTTMMLPVYLGGQRQVYVPSPSIHVAPLRHAWFSQSLDIVLHFVDTPSQPARCHNQISISNIHAPSLTSPA